MLCLPLTFPEVNCRNAQSSAHLARNAHQEEVDQIINSFNFVENQLVDCNNSKNAAEDVNMQELNKST